ncbi:type III-B CRISPR-associated protein Cas10/Cmr2 [Geobacillus subterraneus]|uniref:Type III-B CRISPR-associated protein Cas10/Cmr2 n=1 Tax=Geobacillus subterraneus TaxID=129338 RepID=A0A679FXG6_9BACL|nr:type III-B CRISPR-associated protein Cas10/Cmr2 [Geobacillus subterraneus]KYD29315.1 hypothetical protein B4113_2258 [Geobacillus sp. B4113_201601]BBW96411.1 type III-B CRISPR-associated protein Cas10/Cmr2 [Geobacillus subterraneus]
MNRSLLYVTIGPVQSFIEQARKTQDLYIGSLLLSHLSQTGMNLIRSQYGGTIIFPNPENDSAPNRFVASLSGHYSIDEVGGQVERHIHEEFMRIGKSLIGPDKLSFFVSDSFRQSYFEQLEAHLQIFWVGIPYDDYHRSYAKLETLMGQVKNIRPFRQIEEQGRKCNLTGEHNVLFYRNPRVDKEGKRKFFIPEEAIPLNGERYVSYIREGEYLGALGFIKRFAFMDEAFKNKKIQFPSTAKVAMLDILTDEEIENDHIDYAYVFDILNENPPANDITEQQRRESDKLIQRLKAEKKRPNPYYAMIVFDGDSMGEWFGGGKLVHKEQLEAFQEKFTFCLGEYAKWAKRYLNGSRGKTVYAGGDDLFGFINLGCLFEVIDQLRQEFDRQVNQKLQGEFELSGQLTFTAGICIGHYKEPLADVVRGARYAEKIGKKVEPKRPDEQEKDAFCISVLKRNGEHLISALKWGVSSQENESTPRLLQQILALMTKHFSDTYLQVLSRELFAFTRKPFREMMEAELRRLLNRSFKKVDGVSREETVEELLSLLMKLWKISDYLPTINQKAVGVQTENHSILNFINTLYILSFLKRHQADGKGDGQ